MVGRPDTAVAGCSLWNDCIGLVFRENQVEHDADVVPGEDEEIPEDLFEYMKCFVRHVVRHGPTLIFWFPGFDSVSSLKNAKK